MTCKKLILTNYHILKPSNDRIFKFWKRRALSIELRTHKAYLQKPNYIHYNPVKVGICKLQEEYKYSSAMFYQTGVDNWGFLSDRIKRGINKKEKIKLIGLNTNFETKINQYVL